MPIDGISKPLFVHVSIPNDNYNHSFEVSLRQKISVVALCITIIPLILALVCYLSDEFSIKALRLLSKIRFTKKPSLSSSFNLLLIYFADDDSGEKSVSVLLSGEESEMTFIDHAYTEMTVSLFKFQQDIHQNFLISSQPENCLSSYDPNGFLVIYSSADRSSFLIAERILQTLWTSENIAQKAVILVGNKADLARSRSITSEGKSSLTGAIQNKKAFEEAVVMSPQQRFQCKYFVRISSVNKLQLLKAASMTTKNFWYMLG